MKNFEAESNSVWRDYESKLADALERDTRLHARLSRADIGALRAPIAAPKLASTRLARCI